jgi:hypothetical protein
MTMRLRALLTIVAAAAFLVVVQAAAPAGSDATFNDKLGDAQPGVPDLSLTTVSNVQGKINFRIVTSQATLNPDSEVLLLIDSDHNSSTGAPDTLGADYVFEVSATGYSFARWTGSAWDENTPYATVSVAYNGGASISVDRSELGNTTQFNFWIRGLQTVGTTSNTDDAPDDGTYSYTLQAPGATVSTMTIVPTPDTPRAGKAFTVRVTEVGLSNGKTAKPTSYTCKARIGSKSLRGTGRGGCTFRIPASARGKKLTVTVTAAYQGSQKTGSFSARIK